MAKVSTTNMVEKLPRTRKASAGLKLGAAGAALAEQFIKAFEAVGAAIESQVMSRKGRLTKVLELSQRDVVTFHGAMLERVERIKKAMEDGKKANPLVKGLREWFELHPSDGSVYVECSLWQRLARATDAGWKPDMSAPWMAIAASATAHLDSVGKTSADPSAPQPVPSTGRKQGRAKVAPEKRAVNAAVGALKDDKGVKLPKNNRNLATVIAGILDADDGATLEELQEVAAIVQTRLDKAIAAQMAAAATISKARKGAKHTPQPQGDGTSVQHTSNGATVVHREAPVPTTAKA